MVKIESVTAEIFLIWTNVTMINVDWANVIITASICKSLDNIVSITAEIFLIWTNSPRTNVACPCCPSNMCGGHCRQNENPENCHTKHYNSNNILRHLSNDAPTFAQLLDVQVLDAKYELSGCHMSRYYRVSQRSCVIGILFSQTYFLAKVIDWLHLSLRFMFHVLFFLFNICATISSQSLTIFLKILYFLDISVIYV